jgi:hypothetical protein
VVVLVVIPDVDGGVSGVGGEEEGGVGAEKLDGKVVVGIIIDIEELGFLVGGKVTAPGLKVEGNVIAPGLNVEGKVTPG